MINIVYGLVIVLTGLVNLATSILNIRMGRQAGDSIALPVILAISSVAVIGAGVFVMCLPEGL